MKNKNALILQSWFSTPKGNWYPWLKKELEKKGYQVSLPDLPTIRTNLPNLQQMLTATIPLINSETVVIGHSLGNLVGLRLAEKRAYKKLIQVAGWDFDDLVEEHKLFWKNKINHDVIRNNVNEIVCISSDNDPYVTAFQVEQMAKRLNGKFILIKNGGHFGKVENCKKIPQLLDLV
jgi:uncharacterized protein